MKRTLITIAITTVVVLILMGIASSLLMGGALYSSGARSLNTGYGGGGSDAEYYVQAPAAPMPAAAQENYIKSGDYASDVAPLSDIERKIIRNADLTVVVKDPAQSMKEITALAEGMGGYVVSSNLYQSTYGPNNIPVPEGNIVIRIPAERLNDALEQIRGDAVEVRNENISGQDVTDQYVDLQSRLSAKLATEKKLLEILAKAEKTEDVLAVYQQLQQVQSDIEVLKGQIKYIDQSAALSSVSVRLIAEETVQPIQIGGWKLQGTANDAMQDLILFTQGFVQFLIRFFLSFLPALILIAIPVYALFLGGRAVYRRFSKSKVAVEETKEIVKK
jgi:DNA-binding protein YbaB